MAAVTQNDTPTYNVAGSLREQFYNITGDNGYTLDVGLVSVQKVTTDGVVVTGYTVTAGTPTVGKSRITFAATGAFTGINCVVSGN